MISPVLKLCLRFLFVLLVISEAPALGVDNLAHGFRFSLPDDFVQQPNPKSADILYSYRREPKEPGQAATVVEVAVIDSTITVGERINPSKIPDEKGLNIGFDQIEWQTQKMDVIIGTPTDPEKAHIKVFTCFFPLAGNAVRLRVAGPADGADSARSIFDKTIAGFTGDNLEMPKKRNPERSLPWVITKFAALIAALVAIINRVAKRTKDQKLQKMLRRQQGQQPPRPPGIRRPQ